jgi:5,10-methylenetetrahydromethanopterin reductase
VGIKPRQAVAALREALVCIRRLLRRSTEPYPGEHFPLAGGDTLRWPILRADIPFLLGTWGAATIRACINEINEVKIGGTANPQVVPHFRRIIRDAATARQRDPAAIGLVVGAVSVVDLDGNAARQRARREVALYLPVVADLDPSLELDPELLTRIRTAADHYDFDAAANLISDDLLKQFAFAGTPQEVVEQAIALFAAGASRIEFGTPHGLTPTEGIRLLGERVLPALREGQENLE